MKLGTYFTLEELTKTSAPFPNVPSEGQVAKLKTLVEKVLDPAHLLINTEINVNSGFRSQQVNIHEGGVVTSQHTKGEAADIICSDKAKLFYLIRKNLTFDQLIWEGGTDVQPQWIHVSYREDNNRMEVLRMKKVNGKKTYTKI